MRCQVETLSAAAAADSGVRYSSRGGQMVSWQQSAVGKVIQTAIHGTNWSPRLSDMIPTWSWFPGSHHMILHQPHPPHPRSMTITTTTSASTYPCYYPNPWCLNDRCLPLPAADWNFIITGNETLADTSRTTTAILPTSPINSRRFISQQQQQPQQLEGHTSQPTPTVNKTSGKWD